MDAMGKKNPKENLRNQHLWGWQFLTKSLQVFISFAAVISWVSTPDSEMFHVVESGAE